MTGIATDRKFRGSAGLMLAATTWGDEGDPPVLLLHGAGQSRHAWRHTARALAEVGRYAIAVDHRGHGDSDWPELADYEFSGTPTTSSGSYSSYRAGRS